MRQLSQQFTPRPLFVQYQPAQQSRPNSARSSRTRPSSSVAPLWTVYEDEQGSNDGHPGAEGHSGRTPPFEMESDDAEGRRLSPTAPTVGVTDRAPGLSGFDSTAEACHLARSSGRPMPPGGVEYRPGLVK